MHQRAALHWQPYILRSSILSWRLVPFWGATCTAGRAMADSACQCMKDLDKGSNSIWLHLIIYIAMMQSTASFDRSSFWSFGRNCVSAAPEVINMHWDGYDGTKSDVWSLGVVLYVMLFHAYPFERPDDPPEPRNFTLVSPSDPNMLKDCYARCLSMSHPFCESYHESHTLRDRRVHIWIQGGGDA